MDYNERLKLVQAEVDRAYTGKTQSPDSAMIALIIRLTFVDEIYLVPENLPWVVRRFIDVDETITELSKAGLFEKFEGLSESPASAPTPPDVVAAVSRAIQERDPPPSGLTYAKFIEDLKNTLFFS